MIQPGQKMFPYHHLQTTLLVTVYDQLRPKRRMLQQVPSKTSPFYWKKRVWQYQRKNSINDDCEFFFRQYSQTFTVLEQFTNQNGVSSCTPRSNCWWNSDLVSPHRCSSQTDLSQNRCSATNHEPTNICFSTAISDLSDSTGLWVCCSCVRSIDVYVWETTSAGAVEKSCSLRCDGRLKSGYCTTSRPPENQRNRTPLGVAVCSASASAVICKQPRRNYWTSNIEHRMDSQLAGKVLLSNHFGQKLEVARFLLAIEHL